MLKYIAIILIEILFWWRLKSDFSYKSDKGWRYIRLIKILLSLILLLAFMKLIFMRGDIALPKNAFNEIFFGAVAAMTVSSGLFYIIFSLFRLALMTIFRKSVEWLKWTNIFITSFIIMLFIYGYYFGRFDIKTERKEITLECPDQRVDGLKIALISDLHISSFRNHYNKLSDAISEININRPDILINTGDFVSYGWQELAGCDTLLRKARPLLSAFAISGNHDDCSYDTSIDLGQQADGMRHVDSLIKASGYILLNDSSAVVCFHGAKVRLSGIITRGHRFHITYGNANHIVENTADSALTIFLVHDPVFWGKYKSIAKAANLTLSGHTHGMQVGIPTFHGLWSPASLFYKYWNGLYEANGRYLYVNRGLGTMSMAERIFMPPEITIITLHCKK
jgi:uncharacterized protein